MKVNMKEMIQNESVIDVLRYLGPGRHISGINLLYVSYDFSAISQGVMMSEYRKLFNNEELAYGQSGKVIKGPCWKESAFMTEKKYGIS
jgi:hypothetical protein